MSSIRVELGLATSLNLEIDQLDVKIAFFQTVTWRKRFIWYNLKILQSKVKKILFVD